MTTEYQKNCPEISSGDAAGRNSSSFYRSASEAFRFILLAAAVLAVILAFASDIDGIVRGYVNFSYPLGCTLVNYSAGFIRRGLLGEIMQFMNVLCQPFLSMVLLSSGSLLFILGVILCRMIRLRIKPAYILAIILSPSLILMQRGENILRSDAIVLALNIAASCIMLRMGFKAGSSARRISFAGMLLTDMVIFLMLALSALIHELSASLLPTEMLIFLICAGRVRRTMHAAAVSGLLIILYAVMMTGFKYADPNIIADSWSGIYTDPDSFRYNTALLNTADKVHAQNCLEMTLTLLKECAPAYIPQLLLAVAVPFAILLLSGITVFHSSSSRAGKARCLLILSCLCPLGLCIAGGDFGRWFSICAINLTAYSLLIAHRAGREYHESNLSDREKAVRVISKDCTVIAAAVFLLGLRLDVNGYFSESEQPLSEEVREIAANSSNLFRDLKPLLTREKVLQPQNGAKKFD